jgi:hydrogenase/urease accessory protein HupE
VTRTLALVALLVAAIARAHSFDPALLDLRERDAGIYDVIWKSPAPAQDGFVARPLAPVFSAPCRRAADLTPRGGEPDGLAVFRLDCGRTGLRGQTIGVAGLAANPVDVIVRIRWLDGTTTAGVLRSGADDMEVPGTGSGAPIATVFRRYGALGVEHILTGADHLAFVLGLLLLVHGWRRLVQTITAFTLAHTITLALAVLGLVHVPPAPVEAMIAVSIVLVAVESLRPVTARPTLAHRAPWVVAFLFGLMHGLGFAGALADLGLPPDHVPLALVAFNLGVEAGQLAFVAVMILPVRLLRAMPRWIQLLPPYAIATVAVAWTFERIAAFWS